MRRTIGFLVLALVAGLGCGDDSASGGDGGRTDGGPRRDSGPGVDGGQGTDAGGTDGGMGVDAGPPPPCGNPSPPALATEPISGGTFNSPVYVTQAPGSTDTLWVVQRGGRIRLVRDGSTLGTDFLDIGGRITAGGEQGLLGLAFHPNYASNGRFFVYYTASGGGNNVVAEYHVSSDPDVADESEIARLIDQPDGEGNHNGGMITFGADGFLYVAMGDGGGGCDGHGGDGNGQNTNSFFGKLHRLDVDNAAGNYAAAGNPFAGGGGLPQIWAYGLRNPWRFSFDRLTHDLYIGDVGQDRWEEIDIAPASSTGGENYGWRYYEGDVRNDSAMGSCPSAGFMSITHAEPVFVIPHGSGSAVIRSACSITGGYVYRGTAIPDLRGTYVFGDNCSGDVAGLKWCDDALHGPVRIGDISSAGGGLASFGEDNAGELYMVFVASGDVVKIVPGT